jgi:surface antigen
LRLSRRPFTVALAGLLATAAMALPLASPAAATGNDYPYQAYTNNVNDRWGFTVRQCVSFVAWREAQAGRTMNNSVQRWGNALAWDTTAARLGVRISTRPVVGAIAQWNANERSAWYANGSTTPNGYVQAGGYGHVGYVRAVYADGSALVEQYNMFGNRSFSTMRLKAPRYLYDGVAGYPAARRA